MQGDSTVLKKQLRLSQCLALSMVLGLMALFVSKVHAADAPDQKAVDRAHEFLKTQQRGTDVLSMVHYGAKYRGHTYAETRFVTNAKGERISGHFALVYTYKWEDDGKTRVAFLCDAKGNVYEVQIVETNAEFQAPFVRANVSIKVIGNLLIETFKNDLKEGQRKELQKFVDDADAKSMLEWSLKLQQTLGK
jgi:hypothetical protein